MSAILPKETGVTGTWALPDNGSKFAAGANKHAATVSVVNLSYQGLAANKIKWTLDGNGCHDEDEYVVYNNYVKAEISTTDRYSCGSSIELEAVDVTNSYTGATGEWTSNIPSFRDANNQLVIATTAFKVTAENIGISTPTEFTWTVKRGNKCEDHQTIEIANSAVASKIDRTKTKTVICGPDELYLYADNVSNFGNGANGYWSLSDWNNDVISSDEITIVNSDKNVTQVKGLSKPGKYTFKWNVYREVNGEIRCQDAEEISVYNNSFTVYADDNPSATVNKQKYRYICGEEVTITAQPLAGGTGKWEIVPGNNTGIFTSTDNVIDVSGVTGQLHLKWSEIQRNGCDNSVEIIIECIY